MTKGTITTEKISISINKKTHKKLLDYCEGTLANKSKLINRIIENFLESQEIELKNKS
jgi:hypothetical protein